jgi:hypothetical protein
MESHRNPDPRLIAEVLSDFVDDLGLARDQCVDCGRRVIEPWQLLCDVCHSATRAGEPSPRSGR